MRRIPLWAWLVSAVVHTIAGVALYLLLPTTPNRNQIAQSDDVKANPFNLSFEQPSDEPPSNLLLLPRPAPRPEPSPEPVAEPGRMPTVSAMPSTIPSELQGMLRDIASRPPSAPVATPTDFPLPEFPTGVKPEIRTVEHVEPASPTTAPSEAVKKLAGGKPIHGPLPDGTVAVYLFDRSASMGLNRDTFNAARAALLATATSTPVGAKFQVLTYHTSATPAILGTTGKLLTAGDEVNRQLEKAISELKPEGDSAHEPGLKAAIGLGADYVIWITDASDEDLAKTLRALKAARKPVAVYVARAANGTVAEPVALE